MSDRTDTADRVIAPVPRITIQAFCDTPEVAEVIEAAAEDRRMHKAHLKVQMGGAAAAVEAFRSAPTPNVLVIEMHGPRANPLAQLDTLAEVCDPGTKVVVVGHVNDVLLYREFIRRGVSDYLIAPIDPVGVIAAISDLFTEPGAEPLGRTVAVVGAKGGVGASTLAHNLGWSIARDYATSTVIADLDVAFGTAGLNFNQDPPQGVAEAVFAPERIDANFVDRLLSKCTDNLSLLAAPATLDRTNDFGEGAFDGLVDILRGMVPCIVLDVPHVWTAWSRKMVIGADEILIVAAPELASLRNARNLVDLLRQARPNDRPPRLVLNQVGMPKRPEIAAAEFAKALDVTAAAVVPFDPALFGAAANNGQMLAEVQAGSKVIDIVTALAGTVTGRAEAKKSRPTLLDPILSALARRKAS
ncbi:response regulator receiver protein [Methylobacterium sp. 4-46]|uniref:AAA family ATPase n=1 Tax=unclassified Methylobacterium TaxID=2615210 RepID=UPI000152C804|nr:MULTISPECIES: transcriptional regulator [Methylobacterium]ACA16840.1 response regulator receiver protein [Methylobacterium sp. 4-46]WFT82533.1 CtpF protein [Methylobacterium nodulans]